MLLILRTVLAVLYCVLVCVFGSIYCLFRPRNPRNLATFAHLFGRMSVLFGISVEQRIPKETANYGTCIYIANHQNNYDMVTMSNVVQPGTVTVGKKSLLWLPLFGQLYWLTGNLLIDRNNRAKAHGTIAQVVEQVKKRNISVWMFPEGTRSRGRGLLPFKTGAFHAAIAAGVPIVPICVSSTNNINLNRWSNGKVIVEIMPPIDTSGYSKERVRELSEHCRNLMLAKIEQLDAEIAQQAATEK
ncbi:1-acylglycerol-3-phosphate O-acyltransferase [Yersinia enterocolitica]|uniref:1-acylglycerol-3-phosphate O-acyltransferase n=1 Tax=Yersinia enterocolitica TaxID=630 RepID=UPI00330EEA16|nr:1-acylglycerol-3-phosphate O-acyltransferase [Yersinia enterocolitica]HDM8438888.1 1-acylglycerol-3-phosphate O-acyltransferase [Yersinia enterocolitica]